MVQLTARLGQLETALVDTQARLDTAEQGRAAAEQRAASSAQQAATQARSSVDTRTLGKPSQFSGHKDMWPEWRFKAEAFLAATHPGMASILDGAERRGDHPVALADLGAD